MTVIHWRDLDDMPGDRKDGRTLLFCRKNTLGTDYGGDGETLNPEMPYLYDLACWERGKWITDMDDGAGGAATMEADEPDWWADINPPA